MLKIRLFSLTFLFIQATQAQIQPWTPSSTFTFSREELTEQQLKPLFQPFLKNFRTNILQNEREQMNQWNKVLNDSMMILERRGMIEQPVLTGYWNNCFEAKYHTWINYIKLDSLSDGTAFVRELIRDFNRFQAEKEMQYYFLHRCQTCDTSRAQPGVFHIKTRLERVWVYFDDIDRAGRVELVGLFSIQEKKDGQTGSGVSPVRIDQKPTTGAGQGSNPFGGSGTGGRLSGPNILSGIGGGLAGRQVTRRGQISYQGPLEGKVAIKICVNAQGEVVKAEYISTKSTTADPGLIEKSLQSARSYLFSTSDQAEQCGEILFSFRSK